MKSLAKRTGAQSKTTTAAPRQRKDNGPAQNAAGV